MTRQRTRVALASLAALAAVAYSQLVSAPEAAASGDDTPVTIDVREPEVESVGVNFVSESDEDRISQDIRSKVAGQGDVLASCYALHAAGQDTPEVAVTVDWTITTSGEPVGFTVFSSLQALKPCIRRTLSDLRFEKVSGAHPRARARLRFQ